MTTNYSHSPSLLFALSDSLERALSAGASLEIASASVIRDAAPYYGVSLDALIDALNGIIAEDAGLYALYLAERGIG